MVSATGHPAAAAAAHRRSATSPDWLRAQAPRRHRDGRPRHGGHRAHPQLAAQLPRRPLRRAARLAGARHGLRRRRGRRRRGRAAHRPGRRRATRRPAYRCSSCAEPRRLLGRLAARVYGDPAAAMRMIGVTGTQGKTTTTRLAEGGLQRAGRPGRRDRHRRHPDRGGGGQDRAHHPRGARPARAVRPDARARGARPARWRSAATRWSWAASTASSSTSRSSSTSAATTSTSTPTRRTTTGPRRRCSPLSGPGSRWSASTTSTAAGWPRETALPVRTFSTGGRDADWTVSDVRPGPDGTTFRVHGPGRRRRGRRCRCPGDFNVTNALAAVAACAEAGLDPAAVAAGHRGGRGRAGPVRADRRRAAVHGRRRLRPQAGRRPGRAREPAAAHRRPADRRPRRRRRPRPGQAADHGRDRGPARRRRRRHRRQPAHRGPGGDPGRGARRRPAAAAPRWSRRATGGPRSRRALRLAGPGDIVVVAGKGHETGQEVAGVVHPFDDRDVVRELLAAAYAGQPE